jgi:DNA-binding NtrC family response regulator
VLISGETGVGKELFARAIHGESRRSGGPFVALNCGAIPENLVESVLFGHEKGAFTGAIAKSLGKFREADGGTLFLDEIGELPPEAQVKLLRVLQQREVDPVGATLPVRVNVRVLSATHRDLRGDITAGRFREDLFFRLNVLPIRLPSLRERQEDIMALAQFFIGQLAAREGLPAKRLSVEALEYLQQQRWPGNVRELENLMHRALVLSDLPEISRSVLKSLHDPVSTEEPSRAAPVFTTEHQASLLSLLNSKGDFRSMAELEQEIIQAALKHKNGNVSRAAQSLSISKATFYRKIKT